MIDNISTESKWMLAGATLLIALAFPGKSVQGASARESQAPLSGRITLLRLRAPDLPDVVEEIRLPSGDSKQVVIGTPERPSIRSFCYSPASKQFLFEMGSGDDWYANNEIYLGSSAGGQVRRLTHNHIYDGDPVWSPDGKCIAFTRGWGVAGRVRLLDLASGEDRPLSAPGLAITRDPHWLGGNKLLVDGFDSKDSHVLAELDPEKKAVGILLNGQVDYVRLSPNGKLLACILQRKRVASFWGEPEWLYNIALLDVATRDIRPMGPEPGIFDRDICPAWSRDSLKVAWIRNDLRRRSCNLLVYDVGKKRTRTLRLPDEEGADAGSVVWSPDTSQLVCVTRDRQRTKYNLRVVFPPAGTTREIFTAEHQIAALALEH